MGKKLVVPQIASVITESVPAIIERLGIAKAAFLASKLCHSQWNI